MSNVIFCIVGRSGVGKTTIANLLRDRFGYKVVNSYTTRPPRYEGEEGHVFVSDEEFDKLENLCAFTKFNGYKYGVPASMVDESDIYVIDPDGVKYLKEHYTGKKVYVIGLCASKWRLKHRMKKRGDKRKAIKARIKNDNKMFKEMGQVCNALVYANNTEKTLKQVNNIIDHVTQRTQN